MGHILIKLKSTPEIENCYLIYSTIVDAPITYGATKKQIRNWYKKEYGRQGLEGMDNRFEKAENKDWVMRVIALNRAGENGKHLSYKKMTEHYCK